jgi:dienelactone hydrolase
VSNPKEWPSRRQEILHNWHKLMGEWPPLLAKPQWTWREKQPLEKHTRHLVDVEVAPDGQTVKGYLLVPNGEGPFPAVVVPYYDAEAGAGLGRELRDFGLQLANRGFVALCIGTPRCRYWPSEEAAQVQPLSMMAYVAANCHTALSQLDYVDAERIGIVGHSYGGKWAMFASCLYDKFACGVWSDGGVVFDETRGNVNYWEPWYLGYEQGVTRKPGIPSDKNPRTGAYKQMIAAGMDLHELHALMAPRPFLVSGGAEDMPKRWRALNHAVAVNKLLGYDRRVAMTNRQGHSPTPESNEQIYAFFERFLGKGTPAAPAK